MRAPALALLVCAVARVARAEDAADDVVVHGPRAAGFVAEARERDAARPVTDVASLVDGLPGVHVRRQGGEDGFATLSVRGASSTQVAISLAGVPMSGGADPSVDLGALPLWPGAKAKVFRSFSPAALGPGSLGGALALEPPSARDPERTEVGSAAGSFGALRLRAGDVRDLGRGVRLATGLSASRADDDFSYANPAHAAPMFDPREQLVRQNARHAQAAALVSLAMPLRVSTGRAGALRILSLAQAREQGLPGSVYLPTFRQDLRMTRALEVIEATQPAGPGAVVARVWGRREGRALRDPDASGPAASRAETAIAAAGAALGWRGRPTDALRAEATLDARIERFSPGEYVGPSPPRGAGRRAVGAGLDADWTPLRALAASAAVRVDAWHDASDDATIARATELRPTAHAGVEAAVGPLAVAAHAGALARAPSFPERFGSAGGSLPTPDLRTETAWTVDLGARTRGRRGPLSVAAEASAFATFAEDLIAYVLVSARGVPKAVNVDRARLLGVELSAQLRVAGVDLRASYTGLATRNVGACMASLCPPLPGRPAHDLAADLAYTIGPAKLRYGLDVLGGMTADTAGTVDVPPRALQSLGAQLRVDPAVVVSLDVRNLFDVRSAEYAQGFSGTVATLPIGDAYAYPLPGRSVLASVRVASP